MDLIYALDLIGTFVFAISGTLAAVNHRFDLFGSAVIAFVTALGGGTIRDLLIGSQPVGWMLDINYLLMVVIAIPLSIIGRHRVVRYRRTLFLFDTIGIGLFTILGLEKTLNLGLSPVIALLMGVVSAVFGGVVRDTFINEVPLIFRKEIYATACLAGGALYLVLRELQFPFEVSLMFNILLIIAIRIMAVKNNWSLPAVRGKQEE